MLSSQPAAARQAASAGGLSAQQGQGAHHARPRERTLRGSPATGVARRRTHSPAALRHPASPVQQKQRPPGAVERPPAERRRLCDACDSAENRRRRPLIMTSLARAAQRGVRRPGPPRPASGSLRPSSEQTHGKREPARTAGKPRRSVKAVVKPARVRGKPKRAAELAVKAVVSLTAGGGPAAGAAEAHIVKAPLVQQPPLISMVRYNALPSFST